MTPSTSSISQADSWFANPKDCVVVATVGKKPHIVTFALDVFVSRGLRPTALYLVSLGGASDAELERSIQRIEAECGQHRGYGPAMPVIRRPIRKFSPPVGGIGAWEPNAVQLIEASSDPAAPDAVWLAWHHLFSEIKRGEVHIELVLAGGPRLLALLGQSLATMMFGSQDHIWHLNTTNTLREAADKHGLLHPPHLADVQLIPVPLMPMGMLFPHLRKAASLHPHELLHTRPQSQTVADREACSMFMARLSTTQQTLVHALSREPLTNAGLATLHRVELQTIKTHMKDILAVGREIWPDQNVDRHFIHRKMLTVEDSVWEPVIKRVKGNLGVTKRKTRNRSAIHG